MSDINNEATREQLAEGLAEELGREPTQAEVEEQVELREGGSIYSHASCGHVGCSCHPIVKKTAYLDSVGVRELLKAQGRWIS